MGKSKDLATGETRFVNTAGDTMTGTLNVNGGNFYLAEDNAAAHRYMFLNTAASNDGHIVLQRALANKYQITAKTDNSYSIYSYPASGEVFNINSSGHVTTSKQPSFGAYNATGNNGADITFANTFFNIGNHFVASTGIFTAPISGRYLFTWNALHGQSPTSYARVLFKINGSTSTLYGDSLTSDGNGIYVKTSIDGIFNLSANDTVRLYNEGNTIYGVQYNMFSGCLLG